MLLVGTASAQLIPLVFAPVLSRLFLPEEFGGFALFSGLVAIAAVMATMRYSQAILIPTEERDVMHLVLLCLAMSLIFSVLVLGGMHAARGLLAALVTVEDLNWWVWLVPVSALCTAITTTLFLLCNWRRQYQAMALSRVVQWGITTLVQVGLGLWIGGSALALIVGFVVGQVAGLLILVSFTGLRTLPWAVVHWAGVWASARRFKGFPLFSLPADLVGNVTAQVPVFVLNSYFGPSVVGIYNVTSRLLAAPITLVASSINQVAQERAARRLAETGQCRDVYVRTFKVLFLSAILPSVVLFFAAPAMFAWILGPEWREAGYYARLMAPLFFLRFMATPLSFVFYIAEKQRYDLMWQIVLFVMSVASIAAGGEADNPRLAMAMYSAGYSLMYVFYLMMSYRFSRGDARPALEHMA